MPKPRRAVRRSFGFLAQAEALFPSGGSADGRPSFELFEDLVLAGVEYQFSRDFDVLPVAVPDVTAIRHVMTHAVPLFPALIVYGILLSNDEIDLIGIEIDPEYWNLVGDDPTD